MRVIVVEDAVYIRKRIIEMLSGATAINCAGETGNAHEAIELIDELRPDIVILDVRIEDGTGFEVLEHVRAHHEGIKVIMLTNYPFPHYRKKSLSLGADYFLDKSQEFSKLTGIIRAIETEHDSQSER